MSPTRTPHPDLCGGADLSLAETTHRLRAEFAGVLDPATIIRVVRACHRDLAGASRGGWRKTLLGSAARPG